MMVATVPTTIPNIRSPEPVPATLPAEVGLVLVGRPNVVCVVEISVTVAEVVAVTERTEDTTEELTTIVVGSSAEVVIVEANAISEGRSSWGGRS
jgi:hypothetical protein